MITFEILSHDLSYDEIVIKLQVQVLQKYTNILAGGLSNRLELEKKWEFEPGIDVHTKSILRLS